MATIDTEAIWFRIISVLLIGFFLGLFIANAVYFDRIVREPFSCTVTKTEAQTLFWFNVIWAVIAAILFIWAIVRLFWHESKRTEAKQKVKHYVTTKTAEAKVAAQRTDIGFGRSPQPVMVTRGNGGPVGATFTQRQVPPPPQTAALQRQVFETVASPTTFAPAMKTAAPGIAVIPTTSGAA